MCQVAAKLGVFCRGFRRWHDHEFHRRWKPVLGQSTHLTRAQIEQLADLWQLTEQVRLRVPLACDASTEARSACRGWDEFSNADMARFCVDVLGRNVVVSQSEQNDQNDQCDQRDRDRGDELGS